MSAERRTLLLDEGDAFLHENEVMRNLLDGASDPDTATISLSENTGDTWEADSSSDVFVPIAIASIDALREMETCRRRPKHRDRYLKRATGGELGTLDKGRRRTLKTVLEPLTLKCAKWAADNGQSLKGARPELPAAMFGRKQDKWEPLIAIADAIGRETGDATRLAASAASGAHAAASAPVGIALLADIRGVFEEKATDKFSSKTLCEALAAIEGRPWGEYGKARKPITQNQLAGLLRPFVIISHTIRLVDDNSTPKGYERKDFKDAWARYLVDPKNSETPVSDDSNRHNATTQRGVGESSDFATATEDACGASKNGSLPNGEKDCGVVAVQNPAYVRRQEISATEEAEIDRLARRGRLGAYR